MVLVGIRLVGYNLLSANSGAFILIYTHNHSGVDVLKRAQLGDDTLISWHALTIIGV